MPILTIPRLLLQFLSLLILAAGAYMLWTWWQGYDVYSAAGVAYHRHGPDWRFFTGLGLLLWSVGLGRALVLLFIKPGREPASNRGSARRIVAPDGSALEVESFGSESGKTLVLTHGWGLNSTAWTELRDSLSKRFRVITWDLPGLGRSGGPKDGRYEIDRFASALGAIVESLEPGPVVLVGHSIGGMTTQTFFRSASPAARERVRGIVLVDTTHQDPIQTMVLSPLWRGLKAPLIEPLMHLTIWLTPLVWLSSWQGYLSGSNHLAMRFAGFGTGATRGRVDLTARLACKGSPGVQAKGNLAMFRWRATDVLPSISVPALVLAGTKDIITLPQAAREIVSAIPHARLVPLDGGGHMAFLEQPQVCEHEITSFVDQLS